MAEYSTPEWHPAFEEYCEAIWELAEDDIDVIQARIAERLDVSRPAVSEMIRKLENEGLVAIDAGRSPSPPTASELAERSCAATASPSGSSPTSSACRGPTPTRRPASGSTSSPSRVEAAMDGLLGEPTTCPHGNPIPGSDYDEPPTPLAVGRVGRHLHVVSRIPEELEFTPGLLEFLEDAMVTPGTTGTVTASSPDGTTTIEIEGNTVGIGAFASERILVSGVSPSSCAMPGASSLLALGLLDVDRLVDVGDAGVHSMRGRPRRCDRPPPRSGAGCPRRRRARPRR
jgi:DtxR family transcriptional regulator, Mn-dependent transcriptional regulator